MNVRVPTDARAGRSEQAAGLLTALWVLLLLEIALALAVTIALSAVAGDRESAAGIGTANGTRFAAGGAILLAFMAYIAFRGVRRRRRWAWTLTAVVQLVLVIAAGMAMFAAGESGTPAAYLAAFALAGLTMLLLSTFGVRRALGQA